MIENNIYLPRHIVGNLQTIKGRDVKPTREKRMRLPGKVGRASFPKVRASSQLKPAPLGSICGNRGLPGPRWDGRGRVNEQHRACWRQLCARSFTLAWSLLSLAAKKAALKASLWSFSDFFPLCSFSCLKFLFRKTSAVAPAEALRRVKCFGRFVDISCDPSVTWKSS